MATYIIVQIQIHDRPAFRQYMEAARPIVEQHGGTYIVRGRVTDVLEGDGEPLVAGVIEFDTRDAALGFYESAEYRPLRKLREQATTSSLVLVSDDPPPSRSG